MTSSKNLPIRFICLMCLTLLGNFELRLVLPRLLLLYSNVIHLSRAHLNKNLCLLLCPTSDSALNSDPIVSCSVERNSVAEAEAAYSSPSLASSSTAARFIARLNFSADSIPSRNGRSVQESLWGPFQFFRVADIINKCRRCLKCDVSGRLGPWWKARSYCSNQTLYHVSNCVLETS